MTKTRVPLSGRQATTPYNSTPTDETLPDGQKADHWVLPAEERSQGHVRPLRRTYVHERCGVVTSMPLGCAETYARQPDYYRSTFCCGCGGYFPVGAEGEFYWDGEPGNKVGT